MTDTARADALLADLPADGRGRLKVFLGAAPGVGKTFAMLQAAQAQLRQGVKLRAGVVETHSRAETESLLAGVPQQPLRSLEYRGMKLQEMDLDGLLADPPALALVDELAHSNAEGRHAKRFLQDGNKVKVSIRFRGRELGHPEIGLETMKRFAEFCAEFSVIEKPAKMEGRNMLMFLAPKPTK